MHAKDRKPCGCLNCERAEPLSSRKISARMRLLKTQNYDFGEMLRRGDLCFAANCGIIRVKACTGRNARSEQGAKL